MARTYAGIGKENIVHGNNPWGILVNSDENDEVVNAIDSAA